MKLTIKFLIAFVFIFYSCKQQSKTNKTPISTAHVKIVDELFVEEKGSSLNVVEFPVDGNDSLLNLEKNYTICSSIKPEAKIDINTIPKTWTKIIEHDSEKVIYNPCVARIQKYTFYKAENGWEASFGWGSDYDIYKINCVFLDNNNLVFYLHEPNDYFTTRITIIDYKKKKEIFKIQYGDYSAEFINKNQTHKYKTYNEPPCEQ